MSYKPIIFFIILFLIIIFVYFNYEAFLKYFPIHFIIKILVLIIGLLGFFFPELIKMFRSGEDFENIKEYIIEKYKQK
jgi:hypothetical protein